MTLSGKGTSRLCEALASIHRGGRFTPVERAPSKRTPHVDARAETAVGSLSAGGWPALASVRVASPWIVNRVGARDGLPDVVRLEDVPRRDGRAGFPAQGRCRPTASRRPDGRSGFGAGRPAHRRSVELGLGSSTCRPAFRLTVASSAWMPDVLCHQRHRRAWRRGHDVRALLLHRSARHRAPDRLAGRGGAPGRRGPARRRRVAPLHHQVRRRRGPAALPHGRRTRMRVSVNAGEIASRFEGGTATVPARLGALRRMALAGYRGRPDHRTRDAGRGLARAVRRAARRRGHRRGRRRRPRPASRVRWSGRPR